MRVAGASTGILPGKRQSVNLISLRFAAYQQVKMMTYNVENFFGPRGKNAGKSLQSVQALADVIRQESPDILAVQEVEGAGVLDSLSQNHLGNAYKSLCPVGTNDPRGIKVGYLYKNDITLDSWTSHSHTMCGPKPCLLRDALLAKFKFKTASGVEDSLYAISVHFKSMRGGEAKTNPQRVQEAKVVSDIVTKVVQNDPAARLAVMGDLNTKSHTAYGQRVLKTMGALGSAPALMEVFHGKRKVPPTHPGLQQPEKLDYIFVTPNLFKDKIKAAVTGDFAKLPWSLASDHLPLSVTVKADASVKPVPVIKGIPFAASARQPLRLYA